MKQQINKNSLVSILVLLSFFITTNVTAVTPVLSSTGLSQNSPITPIYPIPINIKYKRVRYRSPSLHDQ